MPPEPHIDETAALTPIGPAPVTLEFDLPAADAARLLRHPAIIARRTGPLRTRPHELVWHDTADGALAQSGLCLSHAATWRLERLTPSRRALDWLPAHAAPLLAEALTPEAFDTPLPAPLAPIAAFRGRQRTLPLQNHVTLTLTEGDLRGVTTDSPACRLQLAGAPAACAELAQTLAETLPLAPPHASLAAHAQSLARGRPIPPRQLGAPHLSHTLSTADAITAITAHLADVILHWSSQAATAATPEPVHQMRVAVRRLRSALALFRRAYADEAGLCPWSDHLAAELRTLAARLGTARDWDVFTTQTAARILAALPADRRLDQLAAAAARKRTAAYAGLATYFASQDWTRLSVALALLPTHRPWSATIQPVRAYAAAALDRRLKHLLHPGADLSAIAPDQLHDIRKQAKRLRYATECLSPFFSDKAARKYLPRLEALQESLGAINDATVATTLARQLDSPAFAAGVVHGFVAARAQRRAVKVQALWGKLRKAEPFWT